METDQSRRLFVSSHEDDLSRGDTIVANADPKRIVVTESCCHACSVRTIAVHHEQFPELRVEDVSAEHAAKHLVNRLEAQRSTAPDSLHRSPLRQAIDDVRAFLDREGPLHVGRDAQGYPPQS
jgi:hypothetical protein